MARRRHVLIGMAAACMAPPALAAEAPHKKVSKAVAEYQDHPKDIRSCAVCTLFVKPDQCKSVTGKVSPDGWCNLFDLAD